MMTRFFPKSEQKRSHSEVLDSDSCIVAYGSGVMVREETFPAGTVIPMHDHFHEQITFLNFGRIKVQLSDGTERIMEPGDAVYFGPNEPHGVVCLERSSLTDSFSPIRIDHLEQKSIYYDLAE